MEGLARRILIKCVEVQVGGRSIVAKEIEQHVEVIEEDNKFLKLLEVLGRYIDQGSCLVFVDKQEHADGLLKDLMNASYTSCASLHGGINIKTATGAKGEAQAATEAFIKGQETDQSMI